MRKGKIEYARGRKAGSLSAVTMNLEPVMKGVSITWLAQAFGMSPITARAKLRDCPPKGDAGTGYVYDLRDAAPFLVKPVHDMKRYLKTVKPDELPAKLQEKYWSALMRRIKYEERAGLLWRTEKVLLVLGETFQTIKFSLQLWADNLERATGITTEQREALRSMVDGLQDEIYMKLKELEKQGRTSHVLGEGLSTCDEEDDDGQELDQSDDDEEDLIG